MEFARDANAVDDRIGTTLRHRVKAGADYRKGRRILNLSCPEQYGEVLVCDRVLSRCQAVRLHTVQMRKAAQIGVAIITEAEMMQYVQAGRFTENDTPTRPPHVNNFPDIEWGKKHSPGLPYYVEYEESDGVITQRYLLVLCEGRGSNGQDHIGAFDCDWFKTFRRD
jgi:hypothetical protein